MKFFISTDIAAFRAIAEESTYTTYYDPSSGNPLLAASINTANIWICQGEEVISELMSLWLATSHKQPKIMLVKNPDSILRLQQDFKAPEVTIVPFPAQLQLKSSWAESILQAAELLYAGALAAQQSSPRSFKKTLSGMPTVLLVGAGIMNLITAEFLAARGFQVRVVDSSPDPHTCSDWTRLGVTHGGGNARMYTCTEADNYNEKGSGIYENMRFIFRKTTRNGGWSVKSPHKFSDSEQAWIESYEQLPAWLARTFRENIYEINREAGELWKEQMKTNPHLFEGVGYNEGILRLYAEKNALTAAHELNQRLGTLHSQSTRSLLEPYPMFASIYGTDHLAGGFLIDGFTVNIHLYVAKLINRIYSLGGEFIWNCAVKHIRRNDLGQVTMLDSAFGPLQADHYVLSLGMTGNTLIGGTASDGLIQGVLGVWLQIPNKHPRLMTSTKIHRSGHLVEDINVTLAKDPSTGDDVLVLGGGYGYVGQDLPTPDSAELKALFDELAEVASIYFPQNYDTTTKTGDNAAIRPNEQYKFCIRPFTSTGLGVFETIPAIDGGHAIVTGGNNTGGFTQAPAVARAVWKALREEYDPIHVLFHPKRGKLCSAVAGTANIECNSGISFCSCLVHACVA